MTGQCPCGKTVKCSKSKYGWIIPRHIPEDVNFSDKDKSIGNNFQCLKSGSLRFHNDGSQTMLGGVKVSVNGNPKYIKSHVKGDYVGYALNTETGFYEVVLKT